MKKLIQIFWPNIYQSAQQGKLNRVKKLLTDDLFIDKGDAFGKTLLMHAVIGGAVDIIQFLLIHGANVNAKDTNGDCALTEAAVLDKIECAKKLIEYGADVNANDNDGISILMNASSDSSVEFMEYLMHKGADVNHTDHDGNSALMWAIQDFMIFEENIKLLLDNGADKSIRNNNNKSVYDLINEKKNYEHENECRDILNILNKST